MYVLDVLGCQMQSNSRLQKVNK